MHKLRRLQGVAGRFCWNSHQAQFVIDLFDGFGRVFQISMVDLGWGQGSSPVFFNS